jgi:predicted small metal-binding protein
MGDKVLRCDDLVKGCEFQAKGSEDEILKQAGEHAKKAHGMEPTPELVSAVKGAIREQ